MSFLKFLKSRISAVTVLVMVCGLVFASFVYADFTVNTLVTETQTIDGPDNQKGLITESGTIKHNLTGVEIKGDSNANTVTNHGKIISEAGKGIEISGFSDRNTINNFGDINVGDVGVEIRSSTSNTINNRGDINSKTDGIVIQLNSRGNTINNYGNSIDAVRYGINLENSSDFNVINNYGSIKTRGTEGHGIRISGSSSNTINNYRGGSNSVNGPGSVAILICDVAASIDNVINNYGGVFATGQADTAIADHPNNSNNTLNLFPGTQIVGLIDFRQPGDVINIFSRGAGSSSTLIFEALQLLPTINTFGDHVFNVGGTTGPHFFVDPTGQSASGASLASLTGGIHGVIDRILRQGHNPNPTRLASTRVEPGMMSQEKGSQVWVSGFGSHRNRRDDDEQVLGYDHDYYGGVAGYEMSLGNIRVGAMAGYARSDFATDFVSIQTDSDSYFGGAYAQMKLGKWFDLGFTLLAGYEDIDNDRLVVDNINGFETAEADFDSFFLSPSITLSAPLKVSNRTEIRPSLSGSYSVGFQDGYTETGTTQSNMTVEDRTVHAFIGRAQISVVHRFTNRIDTETRIGFQARHTDNGVVDMTLAGASFTFPTAGDDTVLGGFFGANIGYQVTDRLNVNLDGEYTMSEGDETNITGQLGAELLF
ncbi:MAG: autotransporter domain-containing protein [Nitrospinales bacterium]